MVRFAQWIAKPIVQTWFNAIFTLVWLAMMPVTLLFVHTFSTVLWVSFISSWALFATHLGAWIAALVNVKAERIDNRTEEGRHFARIEESEARMLAKLDEGHAQILAKLAKLDRLT